MPTSSHTPLTLPDAKQHADDTEQWRVLWQAGQAAMSTVKAEPGDMDLPVPSTQGRAYDLNKVLTVIYLRILEFTL